MFTGIIEGLGSIQAMRPTGRGSRLTVEADFSLAGSRVGDSIAVNGACLTAVTIGGRRFEADLSPETIANTALGRCRVGHRVNLERALRLSDRLDGHLVSGHIDGTGVIRDRQRLDNALVVTLEVQPAEARYLIRKGSVAVDGVSLTVNRVDGNRFQVSIIPHTAGLTTIGFKGVGEIVNIETDMIGKYVERFATAGGDGDRGAERSPPGGVDLQLLARKGFL